MTVEISGTSRYVEANGLRHHLLVYEGGDRGDLLILPGITSPAATADFIAVPLSRRGYRVHVPDLRGRGASDTPPAGAYTLSDYAGDVAGLVVSLGLDRPVLIGHSLGARIAAAYAVEAEPSGHGPVILVDPPLSGPGRGSYPTSLDSFMAQLREAKEGTTIDEVRRFYPKWPERELRIRIEALPSCDETAVRETHAGFEREDFFPYWDRLLPPATLIRGANSPVVPDAALDELAERNPSVPILSVSGAGHMVPWDNFDGFFEALLPRLSPGT
jgi:N-formylmaleamate deformylase